MPSNDIVVSNSGPLIALAEVSCFGLLRDLFGNITIPSAVYDEVVTRGGDQPGAAECQSAAFIEVAPAPNLVAVAFLRENLGAGESEAIVLAQEAGAQLLLLDDGRARRTAVRAGLPTIGTVGVLLLAKRASLIPTIRPVLDELREKGFRISQAVYDQALASANEL